MKNNTKQLKNKMLTDVQVEAVRTMIVASMRDVYLSTGVLPDENMMKSANFVASKIIKNVQMSLIQDAVYTKAVNSLSKTKKTNKTK